MSLTYLRPPLRLKAAKYVCRSLCALLFSLIFVLRHRLLLDVTKLHKFQAVVFCVPSAFVFFACSAIIDKISGSSGKLLKFFNAIVNLGVSETAPFFRRIAPAKGIAEFNPTLVEKLFRSGKLLLRFQH